MTTWIDSTRRAVKPHQCESCWRTIAKGEDYSRTVCFDGGQATTYIECAHCRAFVELVRDDIDPMRDGYDSYSIAEMECTSSAIAILHTEWRQKWRRLDGSLLPIPSLELTTADHS